MVSENIKINNRKISNTDKPYIIAELSGNHNGSLDTALRLIDKSHEAGVDAVKLQTYTADTMTIKSKQPDFQITKGLWKGKSLYELYEWASTPWNWHERLFQHAKALDLTIFSSPFDETAVDFLESLNTPAYKIASFELLDIPLVKKVAATSKPIILSTGMANLDEIKNTINALNTYSESQYCLLHCVSGYPTPIEEIHLRNINSLKDHFSCPVGLSDHTLSTITSVCATAMGCAVIEKHITLDRKAGGPDAEFSLEPDEFRTLCKQVNEAYLCMGEKNRKIKPSEYENRRFRRSIYVTNGISKGDIFTTDNIRRIRPGFGLCPSYYESLLGKKASCDIRPGTPLSWDLVQ